MSYKFEFKTIRFAQDIYFFHFYGDCYKKIIFFIIFFCLSILTKMLESLIINHFKVLKLLSIHRVVFSLKKKVNQTTSENICNLCFMVFKKLFTIHYINMYIHFFSYTFLAYLIDQKMFIIN